MISLAPNLNYCDGTPVTPSRHEQHWVAGTWIERELLSVVLNWYTWTLVRLHPDTAFAHVQMALIDVLSIFHLCSADSNEARLRLKFKSLEENLWRKCPPRPIIHIVNDSNHVWNKHFLVQNNFNTLKKCSSFHSKYQEIQTHRYFLCLMFFPEFNSLYLIVPFTFKQGGKGYAMSQDSNSGKDRFCPASQHQPRAQVSIL